MPQATRKNGLLALPLHALLRVAQRSTHAPRTSDTLLMPSVIGDAPARRRLRHVGRSM